MDSEEESRLLSHEDARLDRRQQMIEEEKDQETPDEEGKKSQKPSSSYSKLHSGISEIIIKGASISAPSEGSLVQICDINGKKFNSGKVLGSHGTYNIPAQRKVKKQRKKLSGSTDNEIKNYWDSRIKRMQRSGLPYVPEICQWVRSQENQNMGNLMSGASQYSEISQDRNFKFYDFIRAYAFAPSGLDIPDSSLFQQPVGPPYNDLIFGNRA